MTEMTDLSARARSFLSGEALTLEEANKLWQHLQKNNEVLTARAVLAQIREEDSLVDRPRLSLSVRRKLLRQEAMLTSKDPELSSATRHDQAIALLSQGFDLNDTAFTDPETLGIAAGIYKRRWFDLGQLTGIYGVLLRCMSAVRAARWATMLTRR